MSGIHLALLGMSFGPGELQIGDPYEGGFFAGQIGTGGVATHNLVIAPKSSGENSSRQWKNAGTATAGADSVIDGPQNTADMVADGNSTVYPAAHFCNDLVIGGFSDWYMPAKNELDVCYFNLKPTTASNNTDSGTNTNAIPSRNSNYSAGTPAQTSAVDFITVTGAQTFTATGYWSSTEVSATEAWRQNFNTGNQQNTVLKIGSDYVRAVRRVAV
tara:strand:- start:877 stop:1524 length:648 start_codon:yes stop_codon:yes gene_type:complete